VTRAAAGTPILHHPNTPFFEDDDEDEDERGGSGTK
jgi:hypothetical protein